MMTKHASRARRFIAALAARPFLRRQDGTAAVEFAIVAAPFIALVFAIIETALIFFSGQALETAVADSARLIMTGQAQSQGLTQSGFKSAVCAKIFGLFDCLNGVYVDVKTFTNFASITMPTPVDTSGNITNSWQFAPGGPCDIVVVRLFFQWPTWTAPLNFNLSNMSGNKRLLIATSAFRNEPYATCP
jgi:Flp pilus assembly protein TadG